MNKLSYKELQNLFISAKNGNEDSFRSIYESTYRSQYFIAYNYINDQFLAQEAVQNMYISFYNHLNDIKNDMAIVQWMNTTTINECKVLIRKEDLNNKVDIDNYEDKIIDTNLSPEESYKCNDEKDTLNKALDKLEPELKEIVIYRYVDNLKVKEISKLTNLSTATVNRYIKTATMKLKKHIENINNKVYGLVFSPYIFKLFNDTMNKQISDKQILDSYTKFAGKVAKTGATIAAGTVGGKVAAGAAKKGASTGVKITAGGGAVVATTAAVVAIAITPNYTISMIDADYVLSQIISVSSNNIDQISNIYCYQDDNLIGELNSNNDYSIEIEQNGQYTIVIKDIVGKTQKEDIEITNIDYECPNVDIVKKDDVFEATISDYKSGIDYSRIQIINQDEQNVEYELNGNVLTFTNTNPVTELTIYDNLGNNKKITLNNH